MPNKNEYDIFNTQHDVYPLIDPKIHFESQTYKDNVVIVTGGSEGIGGNVALFYARAGARIVVVSRSNAKLEARKKLIEDDVPGAQLMTVAGDISDPVVGKQAVKAALDAWGRLDIVVSNPASAMGGSERLADRDPTAWWHTQEVNLRGTLNIVHPAIPELLKTKGHIVVTSSNASYDRSPPMADYGISKLSINRFVELLALDYPELAGVYAVHPGGIWTPGSTGFLKSMGLENTVPMPDSVDLPAATFLWLTARNADFLSGRYIHACWDLNEVLAKKDEIVRDNLLVTKLAGPSQST